MNDGVKHYTLQVDKNRVKDGRLIPFLYAFLYIRTHEKDKGKEILPLLVQNKQEGKYNLELIDDLEYLDVTKPMKQNDATLVLSVQLTGM